MTIRYRGHGRAVRLRFMPVAVPVVLAVVSSAGAPCWATPDAAALLAAYDGWRGGPAFARLASLRESGRFADGGLSGEARVSSAASGAAEAALRFGPFSFALTTANGGTYAELSGQVLPLSPAELAFARADAALLFPITGPVAVAPDEVVGGRSYAVLCRAGEAGASYDYLLSASSGALHAIRTRRNGGTELTTFEDWRMVDGVRLPFHVHAEGDAGLGPINDDTTDLTLERVSLGDAPAPEPLRDRVLPAYPTGQDSSGWVPFQLKGNHIFLPMRLNGRPVQAILDSGAGFSAVDGAAAARFGIRGLGSFKTAGQGGSAALGLAPGVAIDVGAMRLPAVTAGVIDLGFGGLGMDPPLVAILGAEAFNQCVVDIDYPHRRVRFSRPGGPPPAGAVSVPLGTLLGAFTVPVSVEGAAPVPVMLDTGNDGTFQLYSPYWQRRGLLDGRAATSARGGGVGGAVTYRLATVGTLRIGGVTLRGLDTAFEPLGIDTLDQTAVLGNLGDGVLRRFRVVVDVPDRRILFIPGADGVATPFHHELVGLETVPSRGGRTVFFVMPNSPAAKAGLVAGDKITAGDDKPAGPDANTLIDAQRPGERVVLRVAGKGDRTVVAARFY